MNTTTDSADRRRAGLRRLLTMKELSPTSLAREIGLVSANAIFNFLRGKSASLSLDTIERIVATYPDFGFRDLAGLAPDRAVTMPDCAAVTPAGTMFQVLYRATCGVWRPQLEAPAEQRLACPLPVEIADPEANLFGVRVRLPGPDLVYPDGSILLCGRLAPEDLRPLIAGARYIVQRRRSDMFEVTVRELRFSGSDAWLWPCSTAPAFQQPVLLTATGLAAPSSNNTQSTVAVIGVVIASWQPDRLAQPG